MKKFILSLLSIFAISAMTLFGQTMKKELALMPIPASIAQGEGKFRLDPNFSIAVGTTGSERVYAEASRAMQRLAGRTGLFFTNIYVTPEIKPDDAALVIIFHRPGKLIINEDESYQLTVSPTKIMIKAETDIGVLRALETFLQLVAADADGYYIPEVAIKDQPRFTWRGLLVDVGRHFMPIDVLKRTIDGLAAVKMNVFHWHLTEDQGFRIESKKFPKLHQLCSDGLYYTQDQIKEIVEYAAVRGIRVMPEVDMPGHSSSWFVAYPEFASAPGPYTLERNFGVYDPCFDPTREEVYTFLDSVIAEIAPLFPDEFFHIGGDEVNGKHWEANPAIRDFMNRNEIPDTRALQVYFNNRILKILEKHGKKMVGWDEILHPGIPKNIVIQSWRDVQYMFDAARNGYQAIQSYGYYIDLMQPAADHYLNDPIPSDSVLSDNARKKVLGGEAAMWSEFISPETIDSRIWPRTAAIAERFWSPVTVRDVNDMYTRMYVISRQLEELGLTHKKNYEMMLRRLSDGDDIAPLRTLVDVIEPVQWYERGHQGVDYNTLSPLTRCVDAAVADAQTARQFGKLVDQYIREKGDSQEQEITSLLTMWKENHERLMAIINRSPILREMETMSKDLADAASIGLKTITFIKARKKADEQWIEDARSKLQHARKPRGQTELVVLDPIERLLNFAAQQQ